MPNRKYDAIIVHTSEDCTIHFPQEKYVYRDLKEEYPDGAKVTVEVKSRRKPRSLRQNNVLHWYLNEIADETGMPMDTIKDVMRHKFLSVDVVDRNGEIMADKSSGEVLKAYRSTADLSTIEMMTFLEEIRLWSNDFLGLKLPLPNEEVELKFK
jgi:hypothetical protein